MKLVPLNQEEMDYVDSLDDSMTMGEICSYLPWLRVGIKTNDDELVGTLTLFNINGHSHKAEFGIHIFNPKGTLLTIRAFREFIKEAFQRLDLNRIYARIHHDNERCLRCAEYVGFRYEGTEKQSLLVCGKYKDVIVMAILKEEFKRGGQNVVRK
jgi:RimJ/RimL family protein N-acetyltransferase